MKKFLLGAACIALCSTTISHANAAGFYIQEQSVKGLGTAFAGSTTSIDDASTIYFNPAGMTDLEQSQINAGVHLLIPYGDISDTGSTLGGPPIAPAAEGNPYSLSPVPNLFAAHPFTIMGKEIWTGVGVTAPFGLASDYGGAAFNRFDATETELTTINVSPAFAIDIIDQVSFGAGFDIQYADADLRSAVNFGTEGRSRLEGDDISYGYNIGLQIKPIESTKIGVHYRSAITHELDGTISVVGSTGGDFNETGTADLNLPNIATVGIAHDVNDKFRVMGQATWFGWGRFRDIDGDTDSGLNDPAPIIQNYSNTMAFAAGAEYDLNPRWTLRAGYQFDATPTNDQFRTSRTPDGDRHWISGGGSYKLTNNIELDFAATYIDIAEETINVTRNVPVNNAIVSADTDGYVAIVAGGINFKF